MIDIFGSFSSILTRKQSLALEKEYLNLLYFQQIAEIF